MLKPAFLRMFALLNGANHVALLTDTRPDGDTFGSSLAFAAWLRGRGRRVTHVASTPAPASMEFVPGMEYVQTDLSALDDSTIDILCIFDSSRPEALQKSLSLVPRHAPRLVFDHHASNPHFGDVNAIDITACSTCEVVYDFFEQNAIALTKEMAMCLLMGMVTDTAALTTGTTNARTLSKTSRLMKIGGHVHRVIREVVQASNTPRLVLWGRIFSRCVEQQELGLAITYVLQSDLKECGASKEDVDEVSDYLFRTLTAPITLFLKELPEGGVKVSMRSHGQNLLPFARAFGGGGHVQSCGFTLQTSVEKAMETCLLYAKEHPML